jgi:hypothetical protein
MHELRNQSDITVVEFLHEVILPLPKPMNLSEFYDSRTLRIKDSNRELAGSLLSWIVHARRPLTVSELVVAIDTSSDGSETNLENGVETIARILDPCMFFLNIQEAAIDRLDFAYHDQARSTVRLFHQSLREYLLESGFKHLEGSSAPVDVADAHATIASRCINCLIGARNAGDPSYTRSPLMEYATGNWRYHLDLAQRCNDLAVTQQLRELELEVEQVLLENKPLQVQPPPPTRKPGTFAYRQLESDVHVGSTQGYLQGFSSQNPISVRSSDAESRLVRTFQTPLQQACFKGNVNLVDRLIKYGANVNAQNGKFCGALHVAAYYGHVDIVTALLEANADVNLSGGCFGTALQAAIAGDHEEVIDILFEHGADPNISGNNADPPGFSGNDLDANRTPDYYDLPVRELKRVATE